MHGNPLHARYFLRKQVSRQFLWSLLKLKKVDHNLKWALFHYCKAKLKNLFSRTFEKQQIDIKEKSEDVTTLNYVYVHTQQLTVKIKSWCYYLVAFKLLIINFIKVVHFSIYFMNFKVVYKIGLKRNF